MPEENNIASEFEDTLFTIIGRRQDGGRETMVRCHRDADDIPTVGYAVTYLLLACIQQGKHNHDSLEEVEDGLEYAHKQIERALFAVRNTREDAARR